MLIPPPIFCIFRGNTIVSRFVPVNIVFFKLETSTFSSMIKAFNSLFSKFVYCENSVFGGIYRFFKFVFPSNAPSPIIKPSQFIFNSFK